MLVFFDNGIYKTGNRKQKCITIQSEKDIDQLNQLQFVNCFESVFFDEKTDETYIERLFQSSQKYNRANVATAEFGYLYRNKQEQTTLPENKMKNLILCKMSNCSTNLNLGFIKLNTKGKTFKIPPNSITLVRKGL